MSQNSYNINVSPANLVFNQTNDTSTLLPITITTSARLVDLDATNHKIRVICGTDNFGFDLFDVDGPFEINLGFDVAYTGTLNIKTKNITNAANGSYTGTVDVLLLKYTDYNPVEVVASKQIPIRLTVNQTTSYSFTINKSSDTIHHQLNTNSSTTSSVTISSDTDFTIQGSNFLRVNNDPLPKTFAAGNRTLNFKAVSTNELNYGLNTSTISFKKGTVTLASMLMNVIQTRTSSLEASAEVLNFSHLSAIGFSDWQYLTVYAPGSLTFTKPSWLQIILESNISNVRIYKIRSISDFDLELGNYNGILKFTSGSNNLNINVNFELYDYWNSTYNKELHFSKDKENLILYANQRNANNYIKLELIGRISDSLNKITEINAVQKLYLFQNQTMFDIGKYLHNYFDLYVNQNQIFDFNTSAAATIKKLYDFGKLEIKVSEYNYETDQIVYSYTIPIQFFIKGHQPLKLNNNFTGILSNTTNKICRATTNSKVIISCITSSRTENLNVFINGKLVDSYLYNSLDQLGIYAALISFDKFDLYPGNVIDLTYGNQSLKYQILPETQYSMHILYIDYWGNPKLFEMTGGYSYLPRLTTKSFRDSNNHLKRTNVDEDIVLNWNTGYYFKHDLENIKEMLRSKKCWILKDQELFEIIPISETFDMFSTDNYLYSSDLEFQINLADYDTCFTN